MADGNNQGGSQTFEQQQQEKFKQEQQQKMQEEAKKAENLQKETAANFHAEQERIRREYFEAQQRINNSLNITTLERENAFVHADPNFDEQEAIERYSELDEIYHELPWYSRLASRFLPDSWTEAGRYRKMRQQAERMLERGFNGNDLGTHCKDPNMTANERILQDYKDNYRKFASEYNKCSGFQKFMGYLFPGATKAGKLRTDIEMNDNFLREKTRRFGVIDMDIIKAGELEKIDLSNRTKQQQQNLLEQTKELRETIEKNKQIELEKIKNKKTPEERIKENSNEVRDNFFAMEKFMKENTATADEWAKFREQKSKFNMSYTPEQMKELEKAHFDPEHQANPETRQMLNETLDASIEEYNKLHGINQGKKEDKPIDKSDNRPTKDQFRDKLFEYEKLLTSNAILDKDADFIQRLKQQRGIEYTDEQKKELETTVASKEAFDLSNDPTYNPFEKNTTFFEAKQELDMTNRCGLNGDPKVKDTLPNKLFNYEMKLKQVGVYDRYAHEINEIKTKNGIEYTPEQRRDLSNVKEIDFGDAGQLKEEQINVLNPRERLDYQSKTKLKDDLQNEIEGLENDVHDLSEANTWEKESYKRTPMTTKLQEDLKQEIQSEPCSSPSYAEINSMNNTLYFDNELEQAKASDM